MRRKPWGRILCVLLCMVMALSLTGTALAFDPGEDGDNALIAIRITPPSGWATQRAEVEIRITDNAGAGFQLVQVKADGGSWRDITAVLEQTEGRWYTVVEITQNCTVYVQVTDRSGTVHEKAQYLHCFNTDDDHREPAVSQSGNSINDPAPSASPQPSTQPSDQPSAGLTTPPGGQGTVIDNVSGTTAASDENRREFFTIVTPNENVFYLIVDRERDNEIVYFLNAVTESDLMSLAEKDTEAPSQSAIPDPEPICSCREKCVPGEVARDCPVCVLSWKVCAGTVTSDPVDPKPEKPSDNGGGTGTLVMILVAALAVGGAGYYIKVYKPKKELADAEDFDELTGGGEEPTVNEDDLPEPVPAPSYSKLDEPDEPDYPDEYGDEEDA